MTTPARPIARRHHTVPKFYLHGFSHSDQIATVRLPGEKRFLQSIGDATVAKDFYSVEGHEEGADVVEIALSEVEGTVAGIFKTISSGVWPLSPEDRMSLGYFVSLQAARVPAQRRALDKLAAQMMRLQIGASGKSGLRRQIETQGGEVSDDVVESAWSLATRPEGPPINRPNVQHVAHMLELSQSMMKYIVGRPWCLVSFSRRSLITSDSPVSLISDPRDEPWHGVGYQTAWGITFPLTRKLGLLMQSPERLIDARIAVERVHAGAFDTKRTEVTVLEKLFNEHTAMSASQWLFHHPDDEKFVPTALPMPLRSTIDMSGAAPAFDGKPWFKEAN
jgi:hypothetical protein